MFNLITPSLQSQPDQQIQVPTTGANPTDTAVDNGIESGGKDQVTLSQQGRYLSQQNSSQKGAQEQKSSSQTQTSGNEELTTEEQKSVQQLKQRDMEVRSHEMAHLSRAGQYAAGGMQFTYQKGPDGKRYAIGGEVPIDTSKEKTPEETIKKMQAVKAAALAPASPSGADRRIASAATMKETQARLDLQAEQSKPATPTDDSTQETDQTPTDPITSRFTPPQTQDNSHSPLSIMA